MVTHARRDRQQAFGAANDGRENLNLATWLLTNFVAKCTRALRGGIDNYALFSRFDSRERT
jgi:hypothetical protein